MFYLEAVVTVGEPVIAHQTTGTTLIKHEYGKAWKDKSLNFWHINRVYTVQSGYFTVIWLKKSTQQDVP